MKTGRWGPSAWRFLHSVAHAYPDEPSPEHKAAAKSLFLSLRFMLPCGECCKHFAAGVGDADLEAAVQSRGALSRWLWEFHNSVNDRLGKPRVPWEVAVREFADDEECGIEESCGEIVANTRSKPGIHIGLVVFFALLLLVSIAMIARRWGAI